VLLGEAHQNRFPKALLRPLGFFTRTQNAAFFQTGRTKDTASVAATKITRGSTNGMGYPISTVQNQQVGDGGPAQRQLEPTDHLSACSPSASERCLSRPHGARQRPLAFGRVALQATMTGHGNDSCRSRESRVHASSFARRLFGRSHGKNGPPVRNLCQSGPCSNCRICRVHLVEDDGERGTRAPVVSGNTLTFPPYGRNSSNQSTRRMCTAPRSIRMAGRCSGPRGPS
jgi:hypothetical protein